MADNINVEVAPVSRVEGHGDLVLNVKDKKVEKLIFRIPEYQKRPDFSEVFTL